MPRQERIEKRREADEGPDGTLFRRGCCCRERGLVQTSWFIGSRALWPSGTRACRKRAAAGTLAGHAAGNTSSSSASRAPVERASLFSGPRLR
jgi:hypothetical protein